MFYLFFILWQSEELRPPASEKMFQLSEEQLEEIQVLESIYADSFTRKTKWFNDHLYFFR